MNQQRPFILRALRRMGGQPFPESSLIDSVGLAFPGTQSRDEIKTTLGDMEAEGFLSAHTDDLTQTKLWILTAKGNARAVQLH